MGMKTLQDDIVEHFLCAQTHDQLFFFTDFGKVFKTLVYEIPEGTRVARGRGVLNFLEISPQEKILSLFPTGKEDTESGIKDLVMVTKNGIIKKTALSEFENVRRSGLIAIKLHPNDNLQWVRPTSGRNDIVLVTTAGQSIRFAEKDVRPMGRVAAGVRGLKLKGSDEVVGMDIVSEGVEKKRSTWQLLVLMKNGYGKRTDIAEYKVQRRGGSGIKTANITKKTGAVIAAALVLPEDVRDLIVMSDAGQVIRTAIKSVSVLGRATQGVRIMRFKKEDDRVASSTIV